MIAKGIMCLALVAACASCKSHKYGLDALRAVQDSVALYSVVHSVDTVVVRDSVIRHDSVIYRERTIHDTVYITKEVYRNANAHNSSLIVRNSTDTVVVTEWREKVIAPPLRDIFHHFTSIAPPSSLSFLQQASCGLLVNGTSNSDCNFVFIVNEVIFKATSS